MLDGYRAAYQRYCWPVASVDDLRLAPFQLLAVEGEVLATRDHRWQLEVIDRLVAADPTPLLQSTGRRFVDLADEQSCADGIAWWEELTAGGGEGMVVKPLDPMHRGRKGVVQPGIKCRGPEYLRIIYGPEYTAEANLDRLRDRGLGRKRSLAFREFALGLEALERFVDRQPLHRVHECVFGVLAMESEPVDPRL
jgi:protein phosphatase